MVLSREELRKQLQAALSDSSDSKPAKAAAKPVAPARADNPFTRKKRVVEVEVEDDEDDGTVAVAEDEEEVEDCGDEPEVSPMDEVIDALTALIDAVMDHGESIKSFLNTCR